MFESFLELKEKLREIRGKQFVNLIVNEGDGFCYYYLLWEENGEVEKINDNETIFTEIETNKFIAAFKDTNDIANWAQMEAILDDISCEFEKRANK